MARTLLYRPRMRWCLVVVLAACGNLEDGPEPVDTPLASFPGFDLRVDASDTGTHVRFTTQSEYTMPCPRLLQSFVARLDGMALSFQRGYVRDEGLDFPEYVCELPGIYTTAHGQELHLADESATFDLDLGDAAGYRMMSLSTTTAAHGDTFDIAWSSAEDLANAPSVYVYVDTVEAPTTVDPSGLHVTVPAGARTGSVSVDVFVSSHRPCPYSSCTIVSSHELLAPITVQ